MQHNALQNDEPKILSWWVAFLPLLLMILLVTFQVFVLQTSLESNADLVTVLKRRMWRIIALSAAITLIVLTFTLGFRWYRARNKNSGQTFERQLPIVPTTEAIATAPAQPNIKRKRAITRPVRSASPVSDTTSSTSSTKSSTVASERSVSPSVVSATSDIVSPTFTRPTPMVRPRVLDWADDKPQPNRVRFEDDF